MSTDDEELAARRTRRMALAAILAATGAIVLQLFVVIVWLVK